MPARIQNKSHRQIDHNGRTERQKREIDKEKTYGRTGYSEFFAQKSTYSEGMFLKEILNLLYHDQK
jgi:hypothetical protein